MEIIKLKINDLKPYEKNAKIHTEEQIDQIVKSIEQFGMNDPIAVWGKNNIIVEGHGRLEALKKLGYEEVECIRLDHLTDEERKAYTLAHNKLTMNTDFDFAILEEELKAIDTISMDDFGFDLDFDFEFGEDEDEDDEGSGDLTNDKYTTKVEIPHYEIKGEEPTIDELINKSKCEELIEKINKANITEEQKQFLINASYRHLIFDYSKIAEYYAHQDKEMQELMEESALVIIDFDDAIRNGFVQLQKKIEEIEKVDENEA